ncbi:MAG: UbiA prenyltransferase family protein [Candidatus Thermoplasmatota archaeon]|nr:UbiA prenyltransferase family protein [Candidatus Thermoplasmatota archaeon]
MGGVREYIKLVRPYGILFLGFTPVFGAMCNGVFEFVHLTVLLVIGVLTHVFAFVHNDFCDVAVDAHSTHVSNRPLTWGAVTQTQALVLFLSSFVVTLLLAALFFFSVGSFLMLVLGFFFVTLYNKYSKRVSAMECVLAAGVFCFGVFGGLTVSDTLHPLVLVIACVGFLQWVFSVGVSANLKDVEYDTQLGIRTTPVLLGVHVVDGQLRKPLWFLLYALFLKGAHMVMAMVPFLLGYVSWQVSGFPLPLLGFILVVGGMIGTTAGILITSLQHRDRLLRYEGAHEGMSLLVIPMVLMEYLVTQIGVLPFLFMLVLFVCWPLLCLRLLYGKTLIPLE